MAAAGRRPRLDGRRRVGRRRRLGAGPASAVGGGSIAGSAAAPPPPKSVTSERPSERPTEATTAAGGKKKKGGKKAKAKEDDTGGRSEEQIQTEAEAERLHLVAYTEKQLASTPPPSRPRASPPTRSAARRAAHLRRLPRLGLEGGSRVGSARGGSRMAALLEPLPPPAPAFTLASYVLDFGNVVKGLTRKRTFRVRNMGWQPVSFDFDKQALAAAGMKVEPDRVVKLPGLPEPEGVEFAVTFNSKGAKGGKEGMMEYAAKLDIKGSPPVRILFRGNVSSPTSASSAASTPSTLDVRSATAARCPWYSRTRRR